MAQGKKISDKIWDKFLEYLSEHTTSVTATCRALSIEARSYYNKRALDKVFADRVDLIFDSIRRPFAEDALFTLIAERNLGAIKFYLNQRGGKRWNDGKILPLTIKHELENPLINQEKQGVPSHIDDIVAKAYLHIIDNGIGLGTKIRKDGKIVHMKIISLNTWGGRAGKEGLLSFFEKYKDEVDIFCLQEIWSGPYEYYDDSKAGGAPLNEGNVMVYGMQEISELLSEHAPYFRPHFLENYGLMMLVRKDLDVLEEGEVFVYKQKGYIPEGDLGNHARNIQYVTFNKEGQAFTVINFHGIWNGQGKGDSEDRILQTENILDFTRNLSRELVLCGDFNLRPDTKSIQLFEEAGMRNLIKEYKVDSTRTSHYTKPEKFADYAFVTSGVNVKDFKVLPDEVSDHAPLFIEI